MLQPRSTLMVWPVIQPPASETSRTRSRSGLLAGLGSARVRRLRRGPGLALGEARKPASEMLGQQLKL